MPRSNNSPLLVFWTPPRLSLAVFMLSGVQAAESFVAGHSRERERERERDRVVDSRRATTASAVITVRRTADEVYAFLRDLHSYPKVLSHLDSIESFGHGRSRWVFWLWGQRTFEFEAELVEDQPNEVLMWRSVPGADVTNVGVVRLVPAPGGRGTEVHVEIRYEPPAGRLGLWLAKWMGFELEAQLRADLRRFKQVLETGEVMRSDVSIHRAEKRQGARLGGRAEPAAQPPSDEWIDRQATGEAA